VLWKALAVLGLVLATLAVASGCGSDEEQDAARDATTQLTDTEGVQETLEDLAESVESEVDQALSLDLEEQNGSGVTGTVKLEPLSQDETRVTISLQGGKSGGSHPAHIHPGTCAQLDPKPQYPLDNVVAGRSETTVGASGLELFTGEYAVNVHDADDPARYVACADIPSS
jgi:hypothetical protein